MCSTNPENWVTFDDENPFQSPQKSLIFPHNVYNPNPKSSGLQLSLSHEETASASNSNSTSPHTSPIIDFFMSPGPPSNSPLCTPIKDSPGTPCTPKLGSYNLYPIPEISWTQPNALSEASNLLTTNHKSSILSTSGINGENLSTFKSNNNLDHLSTLHSSHSQSDCTFSSPFWNSDVTNICSSTGVCTTADSHIKDMSAKQEYNTMEKETSNNQKSLNQCSFSYVCERLQHLNIDPPDSLKRQPVCAEKRNTSFIPQSLFRSQRKDGWPFMLRIPEKKNMMSSRQWGPIYLKVLAGGILKMYYEKGLEKPFKEFQLHQFCRLSEPKLENLGVSDKIHTVKIENVTYVEKRKYHQKFEVVHEAEIEQMLKLGTTDYYDLMDFVATMEEEMLLLPPVSKQKKTYEEPEMLLEIVDNFWGEVTKEGKVKEKAVICQVYCLCFINSGMECFLTLNDVELQKLSDSYFTKERDRLLINISEYHFHKCVKKHEFQQSRIVKFTPLDACRFELMRFKAPCSVQELPFSVKSLVVVQGAYVELQAFLNMSSSVVASPQIKCCENVTVYFPVPAQWVKALWTVSLQRQRSLKTKMNRRACLGSAYEIESEPVIQVTIGTAKYEKAYKAVVWKIDRLPDKNSSPDQPHSFSCKLELGSDQEIPRSWNPIATVQFVMPFTCVSGAEVKSMGIENDIQPHKHVTQKACYNIQVEIEKQHIPTAGEDVNKTEDCIMQ
ncbi:stonin-1 [Mixophyes fleayi]|uniref:stonin-1 n=1 Tax=Mixophyes fleayi TaxID=3061075 RepID=UPI003F4DD285